MNIAPRETPSIEPGSIEPRLLPHGALRRWLSPGAGAGLLAAAAGWISHRRAQHHDWRERLGAERAGDQAAQISSWALSYTDASPMQKARISMIAREAAQGLYPLRGRHRAARMEAVQLLAAPNVDRAALERLRREQLALVDAASRRVSEAMADAAETLDPEQRARIASRLARREELFQIV